MTRPQYTPSHRMLNEAIIGAAHQCPSSAPQWIAHAMLDAYGEQHATTIADSLPRMIRAEHTTRLKGAAIRACADPVGYPGAVTVTDHFGDEYHRVRFYEGVDLASHPYVPPDMAMPGGDASMLDHAVPNRGWRIVRNVGIAAIFAALAWGVWTMAWAQHDGALAQAEQGAAEW